MYKIYLTVLLTSVCLNTNANVTDEFSADVGFPAASVTAEPTIEDFHEPDDVRGFSIYVHRELKEELPDEVAAYLELAKADLIKLEYNLTEEALQALRQTKIWLTTYDCGGAAGMYHLSESWLRNNGRPTELVKSVEICQAVVERGDPRSTTIPHELAHAYQDQTLIDGLNNAHIEAAYDSAMARYLYDGVLHKGGHTRRAYAATNAREYFAELSVKYFLTDNDYPFEQTELRRHDSRGAETTAAAWEGRLESRWSDCSEEGQVKSESGGDLILLEFENPNEETRWVIWLDWEGKRSERVRQKVTLGLTERQYTYTTHHWLVSDAEGSCVKIFHPGIADETVTLP